MHLQTTFTLEKSPDAVRSLTKQFFRKKGYHLQGENSHHLRFANGSYLKNLLGLGPLEWKSRVIVSLSQSPSQPVKVTADFDVTTFPQAATSREEVLWRQLAVTYQDHLATGMEELPTDEEASKTPMNKGTWRYVGWAAAGALAWLFYKKQKSRK